MILDLSANAHNPVEIVFNHEWLQPLTFMDVVELAVNFTVNHEVVLGTPPAISGSSLVCSSNNSTFTLSTVPSGSTMI